MLLDTEVFFKLAKVRYNISVKVSVYTNALCVRTGLYEIKSLLSVISFLKITGTKTAKVWTTGVCICANNSNHIYDTFGRSFRPLQVI